jgi:hypothetical protein
LRSADYEKLLLHTESDSHQSLKSGRFAMIGKYAGLLKIVLTVCFFSSTVWGAAVPMPFRIGGTVTIDGVQITTEDDAGYTITVTGQDGMLYAGHGGVESKDTDGLNDAQFCKIDIPIYDENTQPYGAKPGESAVLHVYYNDVELPVISYYKDGISYSGRQLIIESAGTVEQIDLIAQSDPVLFVSPYFYKASQQGGIIEIQITKVGEGTIIWEAAEEIEWLEIISGTSGKNNGTLTVQCDPNTTGEERVGTIEISGYISEIRQAVVVTPNEVKIKQTDGSGDIDDNKFVELRDALLTLKVLAGIDVSDMIREDYDTSEADVNGDQKIGIEELVHILQEISES